MHIAFLTSEYPHPKVSHAAGIGTSIKNLADALVNKGEQVTVFVYHQDTSEIIEDQGVTIHLIPKKISPLFTWYFYRKRLQNYINSVVETQKIDVIEAADWTGITAFMKLKVPLVIRLHGSDAYFCKLEKRRQKFKNFVFEKLALQLATAYIAPTSFAGEVTAKIFGLNRNKIKTIHNGLQLTHFENQTPKVYEEKTILYIGTIIRKKGVLELAEIFNAILKTEPSAKLKLIGGDASDIKTGQTSTYALMQSIFSDEAKQNVEYLGKMPYSDVKAHIKKAHVCTFPSFAETLGMVTIESMALQKPVVNTSIGWAQELIDDGINGFLVHPSDIEAYSKAILKLFKDPELSATIGRAARKKTELSFDINSIADKNITFYNDVILKRV
ncbi:glycosyltransferase family 4 protein [Algibacter lectus]|uniref:glycosyltransferase family 4 protein n=1 Tax=Algibacter lectus TaxID=221126 RepID=UPI0026F1B7BF|nr:glycosyltransferase family 4 protein [Algibacter lectus]MDO7135408.1 glycosyltransferase family 4 protein [Algibacter lectus]